MEKVERDSSEMTDQEVRRLENLYGTIEQRGYDLIHAHYKRWGYPDQKWRALLPNLGQRIFYIMASTVDKENRALGLKPPIDIIDLADSVANERDSTDDLLGYYLVRDSNKCEGTQRTIFYRGALSYGIMTDRRIPDLSALMLEQQVAPCLCTEFADILMQQSKDQRRTIHPNHCGMCGLKYGYTYAEKKEFERKNPDVWPEDMPPLPLHHVRGVSTVCGGPGSCNDAGVDSSLVDVPRHHSTQTAEPTSFVFGDL